MKSEKDIRLLLDKFYEGVTTLEEEKMIDDFFASSVNISQDLKADMELFNALREQKGADDIYVPDLLEHEMSIMIDQKIRKENNAAKWYWKQIACMAACVALIISMAMYVGMEDTVENGSYDSEFEDMYMSEVDVEVAAEASRALILVADKLHQASSKVEYVAYKLDDSCL